MRRVVGRLAAAAFLLAAQAGGAGAVTPEEGRRAYDAGHFTDAMGIWAQLGREGDAEAAFGLGLVYDLGNGAPENPETAFGWYEFAADAGLPAAQFNVGAMYDSGRGVAQNRERAALWYARAAALDHHRAQFNLGLLYQQGDGVPLNLAAAEAWFRAAAKGGIAAANDRLKVLDAAALAQARGRRLPDGPLTSVTMAWPAPGATLTMNKSSTVELVWVAPREPRPALYRIELRKLGGPTLPAVFTELTPQTATAAKLPTDEATYAWKVDTVAPDGAQASSDWASFSLKAPALVAPPAPEAAAPAAADGFGFTSAAAALDPAILTAVALAAILILGLMRRDWRGKTAAVLRRRNKPGRPPATPGRTEVPNLNDLLALARGPSFDAVPSDLNKLVTGMQVLLRRIVGEGVQVQTLLASDLARASTDAKQLEAAILHLAINARDAMHGYGCLTIETQNVRLDADFGRRNDDADRGAYVAIRVSDTGSGMPPEVLARAMDPFFSTKPVGERTGLGLSTVHGIVRQSGGHLRIWSSVGKGTTVKLYLPRAPKASADADPIVQAREPLQLPRVRAAS